LRVSTSPSRTESLFSDIRGVGRGVAGRQLAAHRDGFFDRRQRFLTTPPPLSSVERERSVSTTLDGSEIWITGLNPVRP
jgi:hypothetical protein